MKKSRFLVWVLAASAGMSAWSADLVLAARGKSAEYSIVIPAQASPSVRYAAEELRDHLQKVSGVTLAIVDDSSALPAKAILVGETRHSPGLLADAKFEPKKLGEDGFRLASRGNHLLVWGSSKRGALYGVYEVLERFAGCRWYSSWHTVTPQRQVVSVPEKLDETQVPVFAMREPYYFDMNRNVEFSARNKVNGHNQIWAPVPEKFGGDSYRFGGGLGSCHTFAALVPESEFFATHPEYFSERNGKRTAGYSQLCLTNPDVLRIVTERVLERIRKDPGAKFYGVSQNDNQRYCTCAKCAAIDAEEESHAGTMVRFINAVAERVEKEFPDVIIETLAYQYTRKPPKKTRLRHNVVPCLCTIECDFAYSLKDSKYHQNISFRKDIEGWKTQTDQLYVWDYVTDFAHYPLPFADVLTLQDNVRFFRDNNVKEMFEQGSYQGNHGDFAELKSWLLAKWLWNPELPAETLLQDFFNGYYGKGAPYVRKYFDELHRRQREWSKDPKRPLWIYVGPSYGWYTNEFFEWAAEQWAKAIEAVKDDPVISYNVRMGAFSVDYVRFERRQGEGERVLWLRPGPVEEDKTHSPCELQALAKSLIARDEEAKTRFTKQPIRITEGGSETRSREAWKRVAAMKIESTKLVAQPQGGSVPAAKLNLVAPGKYGDLVDDPKALGGKALKLYNTHFEWCVNLSLNRIAFVPGKRYRIRVRVRCDKRGEGEALWTGVWDGAGNRSWGGVEKRTSEVGSEYAWYEVCTLVPNTTSYFWIGPGKFNPDGKSAIQALWVDQVEFTPVD